MRFEDVWFRYARRAGWALRAVDALVEPGQTVVILGRNGAGKSTLLQLAAGVLRPVRGAVRGRAPVVGWVPERFPADQPFTTEQYLRRMAALRRLRGGSTVVDAWMERLKLTDHRYTRLADLSKGTAQKVGLAQALLVTPGLLVLDEPWEGLDSVARALIPELVGEVTAAGGTVLVSDHRGEVVGLPGAIRWTVADRSLHTGPSDGLGQAEGLRPGDGPGVGLRAGDGSGVGLRAGDGSGVGLRAGDGSGVGLRAGDGPGDALRPGDGQGDRLRPGADEVVVEVAVRRADADQAVARLRADGHRILGVRTEQPR